MRILITGGAGFIGCNLTEASIRAGHRVTIFDNLSRRGSQTNLDWLRDCFGDSFDFIQGDIRDYRGNPGGRERAGGDLSSCCADRGDDLGDRPAPDFEINALGTFNVLEAARHAGTRPGLHLFVHQQGLWRDGGCAGRRAGDALRAAGLPGRRERRTAVRFPFALRVYQRISRSICPRLRPDLRAAVGGLPPVVPGGRVGRSNITRRYPDSTIFTAWATGLVAG